MNTPLKMLLIILFVDLFLFFGQLAVLNINPDGHTLDAFDSRLIKRFETSSGSYELQNANISDINALFPETQEVSTSDSGFADIWNTIKSWIFTNTPLGIILQIIGAPYFFLKAILPGVEYVAIVYGIGALWYAFSIFAIIGWALGRE